MPKRGRTDTTKERAAALRRAAEAASAFLAAARDAASDSETEEAVTESLPGEETKQPCCGERCGGRHPMFMRASPRERFRLKEPRSFSSLGANAVVKVYSYRQGQVSLPCFDRGDGTVDLYSTVPGLAGQPDIIVKAIDAKATGLNVEGIQYTLPGLARRPTTRISVAECKANYDTIQALKDKQPLSAAESAKLLAASVYNSAVDIHFLSCQMLEFLHTEVGLNNTTNTNVMFSCHNVPNLDNAFFTGQYMVYGNGGRMFKQLASEDVVGHENGHGALELLSNGMPYTGHSGALNESYADIFGRKFENWLSVKFNKNADPTDDLPGTDDWLMGEDVVKGAGGFLRNMQDPQTATPPQPAQYRGQYWANPNSPADYGGVHTNSGPANRCFYLLAMAVGIDLAFKIFIQSLRTVPASPTYIEFRDALAAAGNSLGKPTETNMALVAVGLTAMATSDWAKPAAAAA